MEGRIPGSMQEQPSTPAVHAAPSAPLPSTRRPRVREVSSRFMSPVSSSSSSSASAGDLHLLTSSSPKHHHHQHLLPQRSISAQRQRRLLKMSDGDENRRAETARSLDSPFPSLQHGGRVSKHHQVKPLRENGHRLDTPTPMAVPPSRSRLSQQRFLAASAATRLLQSSGISISASDDKGTTARGQENNRENPNASSASGSSDMLPTVFGRNHTKHPGNFTASPLHRSLTSPSSSFDDSSLFRAIKGSEKVQLPLKNGAGLSLPPVAPNSKLSMETKKQRKISGHVEDVHYLKLLHNHYLQWKFANAKAEVTTKTQKAHAERMLYSLGLKMAELCDSVQTKRAELHRLSRFKTLRAIVESQIPRLEEWSAIEENYLTSLSEAIQALLNASLRLPLNGNIMVDTKDLGEALDVATKLMEGIAQHIRSFMPNVEKMEILMLELARVTNTERALIEECGVSLSKTHASQIEECSLRGQLMQFHKSSNQPQQNVALVSKRENFLP